MRKGRFKNFIGWLFVLLFLAMGATFLYRLTNGFKSGVKSFYLSRNGEKILNDQDGICVYAGDVFSVVHYGDDEQFNVKIQPLEVNGDWYFTVNGNYDYSWNNDVVPNVSDFTRYFNVQLSQEDNAFCVNNALLTALKLWLDTDNVVITDPSPSTDLFRMDITSGDSTIILKGKFVSYATGISLQGNGLTF